MCRVEPRRQEEARDGGKREAEILLASSDGKPDLKNGHLRLVQEKYSEDTGQTLNLEKLLKLLQSMTAPPPPDQAQRAQAYGTAGKSLEDGLSKSVPPQTAARMRSLQASVLSGDADAIQENLKGLSGAQVEAMAEDIEKNLGTYGSFTHLATDPSGNLIVYNENSPKAVKIFTDGKRPADLVETSVDEEGDRLFKSADFVGEKQKVGEVLKRFGDNAITDVTRSPEDIKLVRALKALTPEQLAALMLELIQRSMPRPDGSLKA